MNFNRRGEMRMQRDGKRRLARRARWSRTLETLERRELLAGDSSLVAPLHNALNSRDVNHDNRVTPIDALLVINDLMSNGTRNVIASGASPQSASGAGGESKPAYLDVNGDNMVSPIDALNVINLLAVDKLVQISVIPTNLAGTPITEIPVGSDFLLQSVVQDVRSPVSTTPGVFSAYLNASYDSGLATISPSAVLNFDPFFSGSPTYDLSTPGLVSSAGAFSGSLNPPATGNAAQKLWTVLVHASAGGSVTFTPSFDTAVGHEVTLYGDNDVITSDMIDFVGSTLTITQNPTIDTSAVSAVEGNSGSTPFVFTVTLSNTFNQNVTVQYSTVAAGGGNAATAGVDYTAVSGTLTFAPTQTVKLVTVPVLGDLTVEPDEIFDFVLSNPTNGVLGTHANVTGTILNDDSQSTLAIADVTVTNATSGTTNAVFTVTLAPAGAADVTVVYATADNSAVAGVDYTATGGTLTFSPGSTTAFITVPVIGDPLPDATESFFVNLTSPSANAVLQDGQAVGTIQPAVPIPNLTINNVSAPEGNSGTTPFVFTATLSSPASEQIRVAYATADGSATTADSDYVGQSGTLTFAPGASQATITISVMGDTTLESTETFSINLSLISGTLGTLQTPATGTIQNDDGPPTITIDDATVIGGSSGQVDAVFTVTLSVAATSQVTVSYATADNSAVDNEDYLAQTGILTFVPGGPLSQFITVPVLGSPLPGPDETFFVNLSSATSGAVIGDSQAVGTIVRQGITISPVTVVEGNSGTTDALFSVNLSVAQDHVVTVAYNTSDNTATVANADYVPASGTLTFAVGETSKIVTVPIVGDTTVEPNETFFVNLSNATGAVIFTDQTTGTILNDDGQQVLIDLALADTGGTPLVPGTTLDVNQQFLLQAYVQDIQADPNGIAAAYLDVLYDSTLVQVSGPITFGPLFTNIQSGSTATAGLIDEVGAFGQLTPPPDPGAPQLLFSIQLTALDVGFAQFFADPADVPTNQVLQYTSDQAIPPAAINFVGTSINIGSNVFTVDRVSATEGDVGTTDLVFTVTRFLPSGLTATVVYSTDDNTAVAPQDYVAQTGTLTFTPDVTTQMITISVNGDTTDEDDETFFVRLSDAVGAVASESPGVGTILNDDGPPSMSIAPATGSEGGNVDFTVSLAAVSGKTVTVEYTTADALSGTLATAGVDYTPVSGTLTFAPGVTQQTISVPALADLVVDDNETFRVLLSDASNATISTGTAIGTILDVPPARITGYVYADINNNGVKEASETGIGNVTVQALRDGVVVQSALTAADGSYLLVGLQPGTYTVHEVQPGFFIDGRDTHAGVESALNDQFTNITLVASQLASGYNFGEQGLRSEFVTIFLNRRAFFASAIVTGEFGPTTSNTGIDLRSGDAWIAFDGGWLGPRTIQALFNATQGSATMTLYNNAMQQVGTSSPNSDGAQLTYSGTTGSAYFLRISGTNPNVSLHAVDTVSINNVSQVEGADGTSNFVFTVSLSTPQSQTVTVNYATADGTATAASNDYVATSGVLTFAPGETSKLVTVVVNGDTFSENDETFSVLLSSPTNVVLGVGAGVGTIVNDDGFVFNSSLLFASNGGGGSAAPATALAPQTDASTDTSEQPTSPPASEPLADTPSVAPATSAADAALEEDEDWVTESLLA